MDVAAKFKLPKGVKKPSTDILQQLGLLEHQHTRTDLLSGGQKKRYTYVKITHLKSYLKKIQKK